MCDSADHASFPRGPIADRRRCLKRLATLGSASFLLPYAAVLAQPAPDDAEDSAALTPESPSESLLSYVEPKTQRYRCGLRLDTGRALCRGVITTFPIPRAWPEQQVELVSREIDPAFARFEFRDINGLVSQFVSRVAVIPAGMTAEALLTFSLTRSRIVGPQKTDDLRVPARPNRDLRQFLNSSPYIDPTSGRIRAVVRELEAVPAENDWQRIEQIYDWVREKVQYVEGDIKTADDALKDGAGDCEELTSVFIAICRAMRIPARMVHVLMHCYPEFYMEDPQGNGHWIPCQAAGTRQFGSMEEYRPILQKGDRFKTPEQPLQRYVSEFFQAQAQGGRPKPDFVQEQLD